MLSWLFALTTEPVQSNVPASSKDESPIIKSADSNPAIVSSQQHETLLDPTKEIEKELDTITLDTVDSSKKTYSQALLSSYETPLSIDTDNQADELSTTNQPLSASTDLWPVAERVIDEVDFSDQSIPKSSDYLKKVPDLLDLSSMSDLTALERINNKWLRNKSWSLERRSKLVYVLRNSVRNDIYLIFIKPIYTICEIVYELGIREVYYPHIQTQDRFQYDMEEAELALSFINKQCLQIGRESESLYLCVDSLNDMLVEATNIADALAVVNRRS